MENCSTCMLSFDVEEWFHIVNPELTPKKASWSDKESRVEKNIQNLLGILDKYDVKATFFVLGWVADQRPDIIKAIHEEGHEIATHGYGHDELGRLNKEEFVEDVRRSKELLEGITGESVLGYRAPSFTISDEFGEALKEIGLVYDSSYFPSSFHEKYGDLENIDRKDDEGVAELPSGLLEVPIPTLEIFGKRLPWGGGGYFRFAPYLIYKWGAKAIQYLDGNFVFYLHSWEVDPGHPKLDSLPLNYRLRHYHGLDGCEKKLKKFLQDFDCVSIKKGLAQRGLLNPNINNVDTN